MRTGTRDVRAVLAAGILGLVALGGIIRTFVGPGPALGAATNEALRREISGDAPGAVAILERVVEENPQDGPSWLRLGRALRRDSRTEDSRAALVRATELAPEKAVVHYELAKSLIESGAVLEADAALLRALHVKPGHANAWGLRAGIAASQGDVEHALEWLELASDLPRADLERLLDLSLFDPVRHVPEFSEAVRKHRVPGFEHETES